MENAVKALSMAGSVLLSLLIIVLLVFYYDSLRINEQEKRQKREENIVETVNAQFETYLSKRYLIGSEVLSLGNLAVSYNSTDYLNEGYKRILLKISLKGSNGAYEGALFNHSLSDTEDNMTCKIIDAYDEDNKKVEEALKKQYEDNKPTKGYKYGNHSFNFWFQWIKPNVGIGDNDDYRNFIAKYIYVTTGKLKDPNELSNSELNNGTAEDLWKKAVEYAEKKNVIIDFSRLNFEVKDVKYDNGTGRIMEITIEEVN